MFKNLFFLLLLFVISCGGNGIEGYVNKPIKITADQPDENNDVDYFWTLSDQPDGSLMNSNDLIATNNGNEMTFIPDYPGGYSIEVFISEYGDEISNQIFNFSILDISDKEIIKENEEIIENEDWLEEEIEEELEEELEEEIEEEIEEENVKEEKRFSNKEKDKKPVPKIVQASIKKTLKVKNPSRESSIAQRTDRFTIQITSKKMLKDAQVYSHELIKKGYDSYIQKVVFKSNEIFYRVRVGSYDNYNSAKIAANALSKDLSMSTWVDFVRKEQ